MSESSSQSTGKAPIKRDWAWAHVTELSDTQIKCNYCDHTERKNITKVKDHLARCDGFKKANSSSESPAPKRQTKLTAFVERGQESVNVKFQKLFFKAMINRNVQFVFANDSFFNDALALAKLTFPSDTHCSTKMLDDLYAEATAFIKESIDSSPFISVRFDGFKNVTNDSIQSIVVKTIDKSFFYRSIDSKGKDDQHYLSTMMIEVVKELGAQKVASIGGDNAAAVKKACELVIKSPGNEEILLVSCIVHVINLILQDICSLDHIKQVIDQAKLITSTVNRSKVLKGRFSEIQREVGASTTLKIFCSTRFYTALDVLDSVLVNRPVLEKLAIDEQARKPLEDKTEVKKLMLDVDNKFYSKSSEALGVITEISSCIRKMERDSSRLSDVTPMFNAIRQILVGYEEEMVDICDRRIAKYLKQYHHLATLLDPRYLHKENGSPLTSQQFDSANQYFESLLEKRFGDDAQAAAVSDCFLDYKTKSGYFKNKKFDGCPIRFWRQFQTGYGEQYSELALMSLRLLSICPHSCDCERMHSVHKNVQTKTRNRLLINTCQKILRCKSYLKYQDLQQLKKVVNDASIIDYVHFIAEDSNFLDPEDREVNASPIEQVYIDHILQVVDELDETSEDVVEVQPLPSN